jgi:amidohydrolase
MNLKSIIQQLAQSAFNEMVEIRRTIHQYPELAFEEYETSALVCKKLEAYKIPFEKNIAKTGVVGILKGKNPEKKCIALRADMDALPIDEANDIDYKSRHKGKMHACGHDVHTANLLGVAKILSQLKSELEGTVKFIFQPSEEKMPSGAAAMIAAGVLENPKPDIILALHVSPELDTGKIGFCSGPFMASADEIYITVTGKGGHAARPQEVINPLYTASKILLAFENSTDLTKPVVLTFGSIEGKGATNIVPDTVTMAGTLRCFDELLRKEMQQFIRTTAQQIALNNNCSCNIHIVQGYPVLVNDLAITEKAKIFSAEYVGTNNIVELPIRMGAEDFAFYSQQVPACFFRIGVGNAAKGITAAIHTSTFNVDEKALEISAGLMAWLTINLLYN